jgi:perosamine synthetase
MIPIAKPIIGNEEKLAALEVLDSGILSQGEKVKEFENNFSEYIGTKHAIATTNGTIALHVALLSHKIEPGDEVITTPFTFIATANAIKMVGAKPVFVDVEEDTFNINPELIEAAITPRTKAIIPVHLFGRAANMTKIIELSEKYNLTIIEDACQAHGAEHNGKKVGSFGTGCFSFYPTKNMTTGEGGIMTTNDDLVAEKARKIINHGSTIKYYNDELGYNYRMTNISAAIGIQQLKKLGEFNRKRISNAFKLTNSLNKIKGIIVPADYNGHVYHQYTIRVTSEFRLSRDQLIDYLKEKEISSAIFYPLPLHKQKAYLEYNEDKFLSSEKIANEVLSLPVHPSLDEEDLKLIINAFEELK